MEKLEETIELLKEFEKINNISATIVICSDGSFGVDEFWEKDNLFDGSHKQVQIFLKHTKYKLDEENGRCLNPMQTIEKVYFQKDQPDNPVEWIKGLNASGYAGCLKNGNIVDRREFPDAIPVKRNSVFGVVEPKDLQLKNKPKPF